MKTKIFFVAIGVLGFPAAWAFAESSVPSPGGAGNQGTTTILGPGVPSTSGFLVIPPGPVVIPGVQTTVPTPNGARAFDMQGVELGAPGAFPGAPPLPPSDLPNPNRALTPGAPSGPPDGTVPGR